MGSILAFCLPCRKAGGLQILRCQGIAVGNYSFTLDAWTLKPSGFCNVEVNKGVCGLRTAHDPAEPKARLTMVRASSCICRRCSGPLKLSV